MNQKDNNLLCYLKTLIFMVVCLLAFSSAGSESDHTSFKGDALTSEVRHITGQATLTPATGLPAAEFISITENKSHFSDTDKLDFDSRLTHQRWLTLQKVRENFQPHSFRYFLKPNASNKDELPDLG